MNRSVCHLIFNLILLSALPNGACTSAPNSWLWPKGVEGSQPRAQNGNQLLADAKQAATGGESGEAVRLARAAIAADDQLADAHYLLGRELFRLGLIEGSVQNFEQFVKMRPDLESRLWELGISYYYAGQYEKGARQFELYQTYYAEDVENSVWRYLCVARREGVSKARASLLPIQNDSRVPMMQIYDLFRGESSPAKVLEVARSGSPGAQDLTLRLFYAHLYIGLFYEAEGNQELVRKHILEAEKQRLRHYMWDVARYHATLVQPEK